MEFKFGQNIWAHFQVLLHTEVLHQWGIKTPHPTIYNHQRKTVTLVVGSMCSIFHNKNTQGNNLKYTYGIQIRHQFCRGLYRLKLQLYSFVVICWLLQLVNVIRQLQTVLLHFWVLSAMIKNEQSNPMVAVSGCFILNQTNHWKDL